MPPTAAIAGREARSREDSSPSSTSRLISNATRRKKTAISPSLIQSSKVLAISRAPKRTATGKLSNES